MDISEEDIEEFKIEALELLEDVETALLNIDQGAEFTPNYDSAFRVFHSLKGGAGMLGLEDLQSHMHSLQNLLTQCKEKGAIDKDHITYFLDGVDGAKTLLDGGSIEFTYLSSLESKPAPAVEPSQPVEPKVDTAADAAAPTTPAAPTPSRAPKKSSEGIVYVVDDEEDIVQIIVDVISEAGFEVRGFTKPAELLAAIKEKKPEAILTDMKMPEISGLDVLKEVHGYDPDIPVIFVSAYVTKDLLINAIGSGVFGAIEKPIDERLVIAQVNHAVRRNQLTKLLNRTVKFLMYQFSDLDDFLAAQGKDDLRKTMKNELDTLLNQRRKLKTLMSSNPEQARQLMNLE